MQSDMNERVIRGCRQGWKRKTLSKSNYKMRLNDIIIESIQENLEQYTEHGYDENRTKRIDGKNGMDIEMTGQTSIKKNGKKHSRKRVKFGTKKRVKSLEKERKITNTEEETSSINKVVTLPESKKNSNTPGSPNKKPIRDVEKINHYRKSILDRVNDEILQDRKRSLETGDGDRINRRISFNKKKKVLEFSGFTRRPVGFPSYHESETMNREVQFKSVMKGSTNLFNENIITKKVSIFCDRFTLFEDDILSSQE